MGRSLIFVLAAVLVFGGAYVWYAGQKQVPGGTPIEITDPAIPKAPDKVPATTDQKPEDIKPVGDPPDDPNKQIVIESPDNATKPTNLEGTVRDKENGQPIAGATVQLVFNQYRQPPEEGRVIVVDQFDERILAQTVTAADGEYRFENQAIDSRIQIRALAPDFIPQNKDGILVGKRANFDLLRGAEVRVTVVDAETGEGVPQALVRGYYRTPSSVTNAHQAFRWTENRRTDDKGFIRFEGAPAKSVKFLIFHAEYEDYDTEKVVTAGKANEFTFKVKRGLVIAGEVRDSLTDAPIPNAAVSISNFFVPQHKLKTDAKGRFVVKGVARGRQIFSFSRDEYTAARQNFELDDSQQYVEGDESKVFKFTMDPAGSIAGTIVDADGNPVDNARVFVAQDKRITFSVRDKAETVTGADGAFLVKNIGAGEKHRIAAAKDGFVIGYSEDVTVAPGELKEGIRVRLGRGAAIRGRVIDEIGEPIGGAELIVEKPPFSGVWFLPGLGLGQGGTMTRVTDELGQYELDALWEGSFNVTVSHPQHVALTGQKIRISAPDTVVNRDFTMKIGRFIAGRVSGSSGEPGVGARVIAQLPFSDQTAGQAVVDEDGFYRINGLVKGNYKVQAKAEGKTSRTLWSVPADTDNANFQLEESGSLVGYVVENGNKPITNFTVELISEDIDTTALGGEAKAAAHLGGASRTFSDEGGQFEVTDLDPGNYTVVVSNILYAKVRQAKVRVLSGQPTNLGQITLPKGARVRGRITDTTGRPVRDAQVILVNRTLQEEIRNASTTSGQNPGEPRVGANEQSQWVARVTDEGRFEVGGLSPGTYVMRVTSKTYIAPAEEVLKVAADEEIEKSVVMSLAATVVVNVKDDLGAPLPAVMANVHDAVTDQRIRLGTVSRSDQRGVLKIEGIPAGSYRIKLQRASYLIQEIAVEVKEGETKTFEATLDRI